jgi:hypothetical protein
MTVHALNINIIRIDMYFKWLSRINGNDEMAHSLVRIMRKIPLHVGV